VNIVASLPFIVTGALMLSGAGGGLHWLAAGVIIALVTAVWNAWVLPIEILRQRLFELCPGFYAVCKDTFDSPPRCSPHFRRLRAAICSPLGAEMGRIKDGEPSVSK
jgi:hypothetical protein